MPLKMAAPRHVSSLPTERFNPPPVIVSELTVCGNAEQSSVPPVMMWSEYGESALPAPAASTPPTRIVGPM